MENNLVSVVEPSVWILTIDKQRLGFEKGLQVLGVYATQEQAEMGLGHRYSEVVAETGDVDIPNLFQIRRAPYYLPFQTPPASIASGELSVTIKGDLL